MLNLIHYDIFGPIKVTSISKALYYMSFIDDYSRRTLVYFLITKSMIFSQFKEFKALLQNWIGRKIKVLRTNNGNKFSSTKIDKFVRRMALKYIRQLLYPSVEWSCRTNEHDVDGES